MTLPSMEFLTSAGMVGCLLILLFLAAPLFVVVAPAIWSRKPERRAAALAVITALNRFQLPDPGGTARGSDQRRRSSRRLGPPCGSQSEPAGGSPAADDHAGAFAETAGFGPVGLARHGDQVGHGVGDRHLPLRPGSTG